MRSVKSDASTSKPSSYNDVPHGVEIIAGAADVCNEFAKPLVVMRLAMVLPSQTCILDESSINGGRFNTYHEKNTIDNELRNCRFYLIKSVFGFRKTESERYQLDHRANDVHAVRVCSFSLL